MRLLPLVLLFSATAAHADGFFYEQSYGLSSARTEAMGVGTALHLRLGFGVRVGKVALEPWMAGDLTFDRTGSTYGVGGDPAMGRADLTGVGFDARYSEPIGHALSIYVRGGPRLGAGTGVLSRFAGPGIGAGTGIQISGRVRALGFLWAPLFWLKKGPKVIGALFLDQGVDYYHLTGGTSASTMTTINAPIVSTNIGFAIGSDF
jgi:uncharacterized protein YfiM (DUF2279 family)